MMIWCLESGNKEKFIIWIWIGDDCSCFEEGKVEGGKSFRRRGKVEALSFWVYSSVDLDFKGEAKVCKAAILILEMFAE